MRSIVIGLAIILSISCISYGQSPAFNFQGQLQSASLLANGSFDFEFALFDSVAGGMALGATNVRNGVNVANGIFSVELDFGDQFPGSSRFLEIRVRAAGSGAFTTLSPRHPVSSSPYSVKSLNANEAINASNFRGTLDGDIAGGQNTTVIRNGVVTTAKLADGSVRVEKLGDGSVTNPKLADGSVTVAKLGDGSVSNPKLADGSVTVAKLGDGSVSNPKLADGSVTVAKLGDGSVSNLKLADGSVTTAKISNGQVVRSINSRTDNVTLAAGANVTITPSGNTLTIASTGAGNAILNQNTPQADSNFNISGTGTAARFSAVNQYDINGERVLALGGFSISNVFAGVRAGLSSSGGAFNSFFGFESGFTNTTSVNNAFFGANSGRLNTAPQNSFFGAGAGNSNTTGDRNSFFGYRAGDENSTGFNNTFIGALANPTSGGLSYATAIGASSRVSTSNTIALGRSGGEDRVEIPGWLQITGGADASPSGGGAIVLGETSGQNVVIDANEIMARNAGVTDTLFLNADGGDVNLVRNGSGNVGIAIAGTPLDKLHVDGIIRVTGLGTAGSTSLCRNGSGQISTCSSSLRYKSSLATFRSGLDLVKRLNPITFDWKDGGMHDLGLGAEDVAAIEPLLVTYNAKGEVEGVKYDRIGVVLINAVKEQQKQIDELKAIVCELRPTAAACRK